VADRRVVRPAAFQKNLRWVSIPCWVFSLSRPPRFDLDPREVHVSIPCWVFSLSRQVHRRGQQVHYNRFNPVLGFLSVATVLASSESWMDALFQSRAGFSLRRDYPGIFAYCVVTNLRFNPVLGFLSVATPAPSPGFTAGDCFNPVLGFLSVATGGKTTLATWWCEFQSRAGFSLRRDRARADRRQPLRRVSIPCWVFSPSRPSPSPRRQCPRTSFNPVLGFLSVATCARRVGRPRVSGFNPVLGFLSVATALSSWLAARSVCFNPVLGFLSVATTTTSARVSFTGKCFNPVLGFLSVATLLNADLLVGLCWVSIPCWVFSPSRPGRSRRTSRW